MKALLNRLTNMQSLIDKMEFLASGYPILNIYVLQAIGWKKEVDRYILKCKKIDIDDQEK